MHAARSRITRYRSHPVIQRLFPTLRRSTRHQPAQDHETASRPAVPPHLSDLMSACRRVPRLEAYPADEGRVCLVLDGRLGLELTEPEACAVIPFIADCVEIALR
jgi:hypothetical protein